MKAGWYSKSSSGFWVGICALKDVRFTENYDKTLGFGA
jgi:hypothetical protein